jgi:hypothetical protein
MNKIINVTTQKEGIFNVDMFLLNTIKHLRWKTNKDNSNIDFEILSDKWYTYNISLKTIEEIGKFLGDNRSSIEIFTLAD